MSDDEPTIETIEASIGDAHFAITGDDVERVVHLLGQAVGIARRHRAERDKARTDLAVLHQLIARSVRTVLDVAGPDDDTPAVVRLRELEERTPREGT